MKNKIDKKHHSSGSALLITVLVIGTVGVLALLLGRVMISGVRANAALNDDTVAFEAANAGLEHALMTYRVDHDQEIADRNPSTHLLTDKVQRVMLNPDPSSPDTILNNGQPIDPNTMIPTTQANNPYFDLKMWYLDNSNQNIATIAKDEGKQFSVGNLVSKNLTISWSWPTDSIKRGVEFEVIDNAGNVSQRSTWPIYTDNNFDPNAPVANTGVKPLYFTTNDKTLRITPWGDDITNVKIQNSFNPNYPIDLGVTHIESTGHYGSAAHKIVATVDRTNGTIMSIEDFVLSAGIGGVKVGP